MDTYFTPLRRKLGIVTLGIAGVFMAAWILAGIVLHDLEGDLGFYYTDAFRRRVGDEYRYCLTFYRHHLSVNEIYRGIYIERTFKLNYWKTTIPLTLLSAWLLLSTPRVKTRGSSRLHSPVCRRHSSD